MPLDTVAIRSQFPVFAPHGGQPMTHYLDTAATAQMPRRVIEAVSRFDSTSRANVHRGVYRLAEAATEAFDTARRTIAHYLNAVSENEVVFTSGTTEAINLIARAIEDRLEPGDEIALTLAEHHSNFVPWQMLKDRRGLSLKAIPLQPNGRLDLSGLEEIITPRSKLVAVTHCSNVTGAMTDLTPIVKRARNVGAMVLADGAQVAPHGPLDVQALNVDFYAFSGHKCFGPTGIGVLWGREETLNALPPPKGGGGMIRSVSLDETTFASAPARFEAGTSPIAQAVGLAEALKWVSEFDAYDLHEHYKTLLSETLTGLETISGVSIVGPLDLRNRLPVVSFTLEGAHPHDICQILDNHHVAARGGHHCAQPLMSHFGIQGTTRISFAPYNDRTDVQAMLAGTEEAAKVLR